MRIKKGFTLVESLVVMIIVGVVFALTMPALCKSNKMNTLAQTMGRTAEQIELGCRNMFQDYANENNYYADNLLALDGTYSFKADTLAKYISATNTSGNKYKLDKIASEIQIGTISSTDADNPDKEIINELIIDSNGFDKKPNKDGMDRFYFKLTNRGKLIPYGIDTYETDCPAKDAKSCTARVIKDGYKINYNI